MCLARLLARAPFANCTHFGRISLSTFCSGLLKSFGTAVLTARRTQFCDYCSFAVRILRCGNRLHKVCSLTKVTLPERSTAKPKLLPFQAAPLLTISYAIIIIITAPHHHHHHHHYTILIATTSGSIITTIVVSFRTIVSSTTLTVSQSIEFHWSPSAPCQRSTRPHIGDLRGSSCDLIAHTPYRHIGGIYLHPRLDPATPFLFQAHHSSSPTSFFA